MAYPNTLHEDHSLRCCNRRSLIGKVDASTLTKLAPSYAVQDILRSLQMFKHYGIVRDAGKDGRAQLVEIDPDWFASKELVSLLQVICATDKKYEGLKALTATFFPRTRKVPAKRSSQAKRSPNKFEN